MNHSRTIASLALSALLTVGVAGTAEAAGHGQGHGPKTHQASGGHGAKATKAEKRLEVQRRVVAHDIAVKDARLAKALSPEHTVGLPVDVVTALVANGDADRAALAAWDAAAAAATTGEELTSLRASVRSVRPEVYAVALSSVQEAMALEAGLTALEAGVDWLTVDPVIADLSTAAHLAIAGVYDAAVLASALGGHDTVRAVQVALEAADLAVSELAAALAQPVVDEPVVEEPVVDPIV